MIRSVTTADVAAICDIYNHHVLHTIVTFEEEAVSLSEMEQRIKDISTKYPWLVYELEGKVIAYAYATQWKARSAYRYSVESTVYVAEGYVGKGIGRQLYEELISLLKEKGIHSIIGGISLPNEGSVRLHEALDFKKAGQFREVGLKFDNWVDVGYWELIL